MQTFAENWVPTTLLVEKSRVFLEEWENDREATMTYLESHGEDVFDSVMLSVSWSRPVLLQRLPWIYSPGHAGVSGNEWADRLASTADITSGLQLGRAEVLRGLRNFLNTDKPEHHSFEGKRSGKKKRPTFHRPRSRTIYVQPGRYGHSFEGNLGETAERRGGVRMGLSERYDAILS